MSVYVDELSVCIQSKKWPYKYACHLVADSVEELQTFAMMMGLHKSWFQEGSIPHYDLTAGMRRKAIGAGAFEIGGKEFRKLMKKYRRVAD